MLENNKTLKRLFGIGYFIVLLFAVFGIRLFPVFNFRVSHGYNLNILSHLNRPGEIHGHRSLLSRFDVWVNIALFLFFPFALRALLPGLRLYQVIIIGISTSIGIELLQFLFDVGLADINDVIANSVGLLIGSGFLLLFTRRAKGGIGVGSR